MPLLLPTFFLRFDEPSFWGRDVFEQRTFIKDPATKKNIPIQAIGLSLYESLPDTPEEVIGSQIIRTQWLGPSKVLLGRRALIVDEVDDSRQTLQYVRFVFISPISARGRHALHSYAITELQKDVEKELMALPEAEREAQRTKFAVFVVHNKLKPKVKDLPADIPYYAGSEVEDVW